MADDRPIIRPAEAADVPGLVEIYNHYVLTSEATFDVVPHTLEQRLEWFSHNAITGRHRMMVAVAGEVILGYATSSVFRPRAAYDRSVETSVYVRAGATGMGLGTRLYRALFDAIADEDIHRVYAGITVPNDASLALHRAFGFREVGRFHEVGRKFDRWWDVVFLEKRVEDSPLRG
jgi:phosphinothricin acetyltransferase